MQLNKGDIPHKTLRVIGTSANTFKTLKDKLLEDLQLYSCSVSNFYLTDVPHILAKDIDSAIRIFPKGDPGTDVIDINSPWGANPLILTHLNRVGYHTLDLKRKSLYSIPGLIVKINDFFRQFNDELHFSGSDNGADNTAHIIQHQQVPTAIVNDDTQTDENIVFSHDSAGKMVLIASDGFLSQFYIRFDPTFAKIIGFPEIIYQSMNGNNLVNHQTPDEPRPYHLTGPNVYQFKFVLKVTTTTGYTKFESTRSLYKFDTRVSIELHCTFHFSRTIHASESEYQEKFLLGEFPLSDYQNVRTTIMTQQGSLLSNTTFSDHLEGGLTDLCARNPQSQIVHCLPGTVRTINTQINVCYRWDGKKIYTPFVFDLGRFDYTILFVRKIIKNPNE